MPSVYFHVPWNETNLAYLRRISTYTPDNRGRWEDLTGTLYPEEADYHVAVNRPAENLDPDKLLLFYNETPVHHHLQDWDQYDALVKCSPLESPSLIWWMVGKSYDELKEIRIEEKEKDLSWITSSAGKDVSPGIRFIRQLMIKAGYKKYEKKGIGFIDQARTDAHIIRMDFLDDLTERYPGLLDLYGRGEEFSGPHYHGAIDDKWDGLHDYRYSLAVENYRGPNYVTEKIVDAFLAWCMPIYWGCENIGDFFPEDSFVSLDIEDDDAPQKVKEIVESDRREENLDAIAEARRLILDEYQVWPRVKSELQNYHATS